MEVLHKDFISSESSGEEELGDGLQRPVMKISPYHGEVLKLRVFSVV